VRCTRPLVEGRDSTIHPFHFFYGNGMRMVNGPSSHWNEPMFFFSFLMIVSYLQSQHVHTYYVLRSPHWTIQYLYQDVPSCYVGVSRSVTSQGNKLLLSTNELHKKCMFMLNYFKIFFVCVSEGPKLGSKSFLIGNSKLATVSILALPSYLSGRASRRI
jgi:hypothetical protein